MQPQPANMVASWPLSWQAREVISSGENDRPEHCHPGASKQHRSTGKRSHSSEQQRRSLEQRQQQQQGLNAPALVAMGAVSMWCGLKGAIQAYQQLRRRSLRRLLAEVAPVLDQLGVQYWADFGTLLGMYREHDIILHDNDVDLVIYGCEDWDVLLLDLKKQLPQFKVIWCVPSEDASVRWIRVLCGAGIMDLYCGFECTSDPKNVAIPQGHGDLCDVRRDLVFPLGRLHFKGVAVSVPGNITGVLTHRYGADFMTPKYMDKGRDSIEQGKLYARLLGALGKAGLRI